MNPLFKDRFFLLCVVISLVFSITLLFDIENTEPDGEIGVVSQVKESSKGFVFDFLTSDGSTIHCFFKERPEEGKIYKISGTWSEDKTIFFVKSLTLI